MPDDMNAIRSDIGELQQWRGVAEHRMSAIEAHYQQEVKHRIRLEAEVNQVDRKVSRIEGGIEFLKWSVPVSITLATAIGGFIVWLLAR